MNKLEFDYILQNGESYLVEFKERVNSSLAREMTAFANASGGRIFLGVTDNGKAGGIEITNKLRSRIQDFANNCQPYVPVDLKYVKMAVEMGPHLKYSISAIIPS